MLYEILLSPQAKPCANIPNKHSIYKKPHKLQNDLRFRIVGN